MERELFTATDFGDTLEYFAIKQEPGENNGIKLPVKYRVVTARSGLLKHMPAS